MNIDDEATKFSQYIIGVTPSVEVIKRYDTIVNASPVTLSREDEAIMTFVHKHPRLLPAIDSYAALVRPDLELRRRLFILFAVLEATPEYSSKFLPRDGGFFYLFTIAGVSLRVVFRVIVGAFVMMYIGAKR